MLDVDGASAALEQFETVCDEYDASVADANADLEAAAKITCAEANIGNVGGVIAAVLKALLG